MIMMVKLSCLLDDLPLPIISWSGGDAQISGVVLDNRQVQPGYLFVARKGNVTDGHLFIRDAIQRGASAVVGEQHLEALGVPYIRVDNSQEALAYLAAAFYGHPARGLTMVGVTGTDGKTTTCNLIYQILRVAGIKAGLVSTVNAVIGDQVLDTGFHVTTPDAPDVQRYLSLMRKAGLTHVVLETTSHGWAQYRVDACEFDIGVVTNITHEHLDEHGTFENYRAAKSRLFQSLAVTRTKPKGNPRMAVLNCDDSSYSHLSGIIPGFQVSYGLDAAAQVRAESVVYTPAGIRFNTSGPGFSVEVTSPLVGAFNVSNVLAALSATVVGLGVDPEIAANGIASMEGIPGRMERIDLGQDFTAIVDFAHTPNALKGALETARELTTGRVIVIFGSAGLRDREKRRLMAETSVLYADLAILTAEDPRTESLESILAEMAEGAKAKGGREGRTFWRIPDRGEAIRSAVRLAKPGDIVIACGKGHEQSMCFGTVEHPWDDRVAMRAALSESLAIAGPAMPRLPTRKTN